MVCPGGCHRVRFHLNHTATLSAQYPPRRTANACFKDAADLYAEIGNYPDAIARYDQVANGSLGSNLTKYSVKDHWLRAGLCALAMGVRSRRLTLIRSTDSRIGHCRMPKERNPL